MTTAVYVLLNLLTIYKGGIKVNRLLVGVALELFQGFQTGG